MNGLTYQSKPAKVPIRADQAEFDRFLKPKMAIPSIEPNILLYQL